jgi:hypothetical protein
VQRTWTVNPCQKKYKGKHTKKLSTTNNVKFHFLPIDKELKKKKNYNAQCCKRHREGSSMLCCGTKKSLILLILKFENPLPKN